MKQQVTKATLFSGMLCIVSLASAGPLPGQGTWETTLHPRDINGDGIVDAYWDEVLDLLWLANANAGARSSYDNGSSTTDGRMTWANASAWATNLNVYGVTGWRLPTMLDNDTEGCNFAYTSTDCGYNPQTGSAATTIYSELASMFYDTLGNKASYDPSGNIEQASWGLTNTGPFGNLQSYPYWSGVQYAPSTGHAWEFGMDNGFQGYASKSTNRYAWAVRDGDISPAFSCDGFAPPFEEPLSIKKKSKRVIPVNIVLQDQDGNIVTNADIVASPVIDVSFQGTAFGDAPPESHELMSVGSANDGNMFRFDSDSRQWIYNLGTRYFSAPGTYLVTVESGDTSEYVITSGDGNCAQTFVRLP